MLNIYLKVTIEENWRTQNFNLLSLKSSSQGQFAILNILNEYGHFSRSSLPITSLMSLVSNAVL